MALSLLAANNAQTVLAAGISSTATSLTVNTGTGTLFPSPVAGNSFFKLTIIDAATGSLTEIVHVTARTGDVFTIQRGQEGTVPRAWSANDIAANMMTAGTLSYILGNFQPLDPTLTALAALVGVANKLPYFNGDDTAALTDLTQVGRDIIGKSSIADILTYLGFTQVGRDIIAGGTASDVLAYLGVPNLLNGKQDADNTLTALARLAGAANKLPYFSGPDVMSMTDFSDIGRAIIAASTKSSVLSYLELGSAAKKNTGTDADQIPDMSSFAFGSRWITLPSGHIIQFDVLTAGVGDKANWPVTNYPIPFPNELLLPPVAIHTGNGAVDTSVNFIVDTEASLTRFRAGTNGLTPQNGAYIAIGR
ncbi:gp53-like domain-containing protein [Citrobacter freundii]|uniref:gp53-like domain-containing protein n=1 Tax=Citrobacter freundii TaxID=546 RepID=UPI001BD13621|nr:hypothetical protein [Citrobacter freundii]